MKFLDFNNNIVGNTFAPVPEGSIPFLIFEIYKNYNGDTIFPCDSLEQLEKIEQVLIKLGVKPLVFKAYDTLPYDKSHPTRSIIAQRLQTLYELSISSREKRIILVDVKAILQKIIPIQIVKDNFIKIKTGDTLSMEELQKFLYLNGYKKLGTVVDPGEYSVRGDIIDVFSATKSNPIRINFFDNQIEKIKVFDVITQSSIENIDEFIIIPGSEIILNDISKDIFVSNYQKKFGVQTKDSSVLQEIQNGILGYGINSLTPLFYETTSIVLEYANNPVIIDSHNTKSLLTQNNEDFYEYYNIRKNNNEYVLEPTELFENVEVLNNYNKIIFTNFKSANTVDTNINSLPLQLKGVDKAIDYISKNRDKIIVVCYENESFSENLSSLLENENIKTQTKSISEIKESLNVNSIYFCNVPITSSFIYNNMVFLSENEITEGEKKRRTTGLKFKPEQIITHAQNIEDGDLIVHLVHGIGRYKGLKTLDLNNKKHDCLEIEYKGGDKLFLPVENIDTVGRYGTGGEEAYLDTLGATGFQQKQAKLKQRIKDIAYKLLQTSAKRSTIKGIYFDYDKELFEKFAKSFKYAETDGQLSAINDILNDLESQKVVDRLVCGDVGFGKTEVALRAVAIAVLSGYQVAVFAPTTLLVRQHFQTFKNRFKDLAVNIAQLSRLTSIKDNKVTKEKVANGEVDIIIGTHALLSKTVEFKKLGLLVVDEEQNFGVEHKEKIKSLKEQINIITLTATPIPRTLQLALSGIRDLSIIASPPVDRLPVQTYVLPYDDILIKEAILREKNRGGQIFYVCPRLKDINSVWENLQKLVPNLKMVIAHGQMTPTELEDTMTTFVDGKADILISTNIIESGLDIPNANTLIVHRCHLFGLAQLYQLRGRVGRSKTKAFAYFTIEESMVLTENANKRLEVLQSLDTLGSGFTLAQYDMDIRGSGNLLGEEQSGHIREVGIELYQKMLEEEISIAKSKLNGETVVDETFSPEFQMPIPIYIPDNYVQDIDVRLNLYRKIGEIKKIHEIEYFKDELIDRFGKIPEPLKNLLRTIELKLIAIKANVSGIQVGNKGFVLTFYKGSFTNVNGLIELVQKNPIKFKVRPSGELVVIDKLDDDNEIFVKLEQVLKTLAEIAL